MNLPQKHALIVGGTSGVGLTVAQRLAARGQIVTVTSRDPERAENAAERLGAGHRGVGLDLTRPELIPSNLDSLGAIDHVVLCAIERDANHVRQYDLASATRAIGLKLVGYTAVIAALCDRLTPEASIVVIGGISLARPYPGSTSLSIANGGVDGLARTLACELAPVRVNVIHPGALADTQTIQAAPAALSAKVLSRTPIGRLVGTNDIADAALFFLDCGGVNGVDMLVDGGFHLT